MPWSENMLHNINMNSCKSQIQQFLNPWCKIIILSTGNWTVDGWKSRIPLRRYSSRILQAAMSTYRRRRLIPIWKSRLFHHYTTGIGFQTWEPVDPWVPQTPKLYIQYYNMYILYYIHQECSIQCLNKSRYMYIYIHRERERERKKKHVCKCSTYLEQIYYVQKKCNIIIYIYIYLAIYVYIYIYMQIHW